MRSGHSPAFRLLHEAIHGEKQVLFSYEGFPREICPYILGHKGGVEKLLAFQFGGKTSTRRLGWKCFDVSKMGDVRLREGPWLGDAAHRSTQRCVDDVYIDVNTSVPNQPGRR